MEPRLLHGKRAALWLLCAALLMVPGPLAQGIPRAGSDGAFQPGNRSLAERLGYDARAKLLIVHADDIGVSHSVNAATFAAMKTGLVNSGSIMVPCPWLPEVAAYARAHPDADLGLHLTLTSEWEHYKWGPVSSARVVPSLIDPRGYLYGTLNEALAAIAPREAAAEIRAQIERAKALGIRPTHLDSHMGALFQTRELFEVYVQAGRDHGLPVLIARGARPADRDMWGLKLGPSEVVIDRLVAAHTGVAPDEWKTFYTGVISTLAPGVTELIVHLAYDDREMRAVTALRPHWYDASWRQRDFDFFTSDHFAWLLRKHDVKLITWRDIGKLTRQHTQ